MLQTPLNVVKKEFRQKEWECVFSLIMAIIVLFISAVEGSNASTSITSTACALIVWAVGRSLFWISNRSKKNKMVEKVVDVSDTLVPQANPTPKSPRQKWMEWANSENEKERLEFVKQQQLKKEEERQREKEDLAQLKKKQLDFLEKSIIREEKDGVVSWYYVPVEHEEYIEFREQSIEVKTNVLDGRLANSNDIMYCKLSWADRNNLYGVAFPKQGILKLPRDVAVFKFVSPNGLIASLDTSDQAIAEYEEEKQRKIDEARNRIIQRRQEEEEQEKEKIRQKLLKQKKQRELERKVQQEMIENGELAMDGTKRRHIPHSVVSEVYRRDGARCVICGSTENLQLDHIIPFSKGGADTAENLQILCQKCNLEKSNKI